jgi:hypothetical protein
VQAFPNRSWTISTALFRPPHAPKFAHAGTRNARFTRDGNSVVSESQGVQEG